MTNAYPPIPDVWGLTTPAQRAEAMAASTEEPCLLSTSMPRAVQRAASVTTAPRWKICRTRRAVVPREGCWGHPAPWDLKPEATAKAVADLHFQVPPKAGGSTMSLGPPRQRWPLCMQPWPSAQPASNSRGAALLGHVSPCPPQPQSKG